MVKTGTSFEVTVWCNAQNTAMVSNVLDRMGKTVRPICVGAPPGHDVGDLANRLDCLCEDDLRTMVLDHPAAFVLFAAPTAHSARDVSHVLDQGTTVLAVEPIVASFDDLATCCVRQRFTSTAKPSFAGGRGRIETAAPFLRCPGWVAAADPTEVLASPRLVQFGSIGPRQDRSLFARLFEAWQVVLNFGTLPQSIDASLNGPLSHLPHDLRAVTGHLAAHVRFGDRLAALIVASDTAGRTERSLRLLGDEAQLWVGDVDYELHDANGRLVDECSSQSEDQAFADLVAADWSRLIDRGSIPASVDVAIHEVLACCLASLLSARTGQPESPATILDMQTRP